MVIGLPPCSLSRWRRWAVIAAWRRRRRATVIARWRRRRRSAMAGGPAGGAGAVWRRRRRAEEIVVRRRRWRWTMVIGPAGGTRPTAIVWSGLAASRPIPGRRRFSRLGLRPRGPRSHQQTSHCRYDDTLFHNQLSPPVHWRGVAGGNSRFPYGTLLHLFDQACRKNSPIFLYLRLKMSHSCQKCPTTRGGWRDRRAGDR